MSTRAVQTPLLLLGTASFAALPTLRHARNRLLSGEPVNLPHALAIAPRPALALAIAGLLLLIPLIRPQGRTVWLGMAGAGLAIAATLALAATAAAELDQTPAARTAIGPGAWCLVAAALLLASDGVQRLGPRPMAVAAALLLVLAPTAALLGSGALAPLSLLREYAAQRDSFGAALLRHLELVAAALAPALLIGLPLGVSAQRSASVRRIAFPVLNVIQTVPSIALFGLLIGPLAALGQVIPGVAGVGPVPAILALVLYALLPIVRNTAEGLDAVPPALRLAARAMGMSAAQTFRHLELPLAAPILLSGLRITTVQSIGLAAVSALIGAGGLGAIIFQGLFANALDLVLLGALPVIALAVAADLLFRGLAAALA